MKKFLFGLIISLILCGVSSADIIYTTSNGNMGLIEITSSRDVGVPSVKYSGLGSNLFVAPYWDGERSCAILIDRTDDVINTSGDEALIFYSGNLANPINSKPTTLTGVYDTHSIGYSLNGRSIFLASYANGTIKEFDSQKLTPGHSYTHKQNASDDIYTPHALGIRADYYSIYTLLNINPSKSLFMKFDGQLKRDVEEFEQYEINSDTSSMTMLGNGQYVFACPDDVKILSGGRVSSLISSDYPVKSLCQDRRDGFYFLSQGLSNDVLFDRLGHYSWDNKTISYLRENESGSACYVVRDTSHNTLAAITGDKIFLYSMYDDSLIGEFDSVALGGEPVCVAMNAAGGYDTRSSSSGCELSGLGIILCALCVKKILRRK